MLKCEPENFKRASPPSLVNKADLSALVRLVPSYSCLGMPMNFISKVKAMFWEKAYS